jgi:phosphonate transport system substrate-binding protein
MGRLWFIFLHFPAALLFCIFLSGASPAQAGKSGSVSDPSPLIFIIPPVEKVSEMYGKFLPLKEYLEKEISRKVVLKIAKDYDAAIEAVGTGEAHLAYLDPSAYCEAKQRYGVIPLARAVRAGSSTYKSVIVTRKGSAFSRIIDLKGKKIALGNIWSSSSSLIPLVMFKELGIGIKDFASVDYLEHEDRIALSVLTGRHDAGGLSQGVAIKYVKDGLRVIKTSEAIPQYSLSAWSGLPEDLRNRIKKAVLSISSDSHAELIKGMKDISGFSPTEDRDFDVVRVMIKNLTGKNYIEYGRNSVKVAILPLYSAITLFERFDPLMRYLSEKTGYEFKLVIPKDFEDFFDIIREGRVEFSYSNPYIYIQLAEKGYVKAFANTVLKGTGDIFRGIIITHNDSDIRKLDDLKGKNVMIVSFKSAAGFLAQKLYLYENGIDVLRDLRLVDGKRQEEVILNVYGKKVDAGFVRESALDVLREEIDLGKIRILARTPYIANWPFAATKKADDKITKLVQNILLELRDSETLSAAQISGFKPADDTDFDSLRDWIGKHENK